MKTHRKKQSLNLVADKALGRPQWGHGVAAWCGRLVSNASTIIFSTLDHRSGKSNKVLGDMAIDNFFKLGSQTQFVHSKQRQKHHNSKTKTYTQKPASQNQKHILVWPLGVAAW